MSKPEKTSLKEILQGCVVAFGMYSRIPVIPMGWTPGNMRYCMCFFPLIGVVCGACTLLLDWLFSLRKLGGLARSACLMMVPLAVTGGIHLDGLLDTSDALSSHRSISERLEIMKDSHAGAFAIIIGASYLIVQFGFYTETDRHTLYLAAIGFALSRAYSGLALVIFPKAKNSGLLRAFSDAAVGRRVAITMGIWIAAASAALIAADLRKGAAAALIAAGVFVWYRFFAIRKFGGITGDTEGFFLQICELLMLMGVVLI